MGRKAANKGDVVVGQVGEERGIRTECRFEGGDVGFLPSATNTLVLKPNMNFLSWLYNYLNRTICPQDFSLSQGRMLLIKSNTGTRNILNTLSVLMHLFPDVRYRFDVNPS